MKCISCGREIPAGNVYCPLCGKEAQIISDKSVLEEDLLKILMEDEDATHLYNAEAEEAARQEKELQKKRKAELMRKKRQQRLLLILVIIIACLVCLFLMFFIKKNNSYDSVMEKAEVAYHKGKYEEALTLTTKALDKQPDSLDAYLLFGDVYVQMDEFENAEKCYKKVLSMDEANYDAYEKLLMMHSKNKDYEAIQSLYLAIPEDEKLTDLFDRYLVSMPAVNIPGGEYSEPLKLEFTYKRGLQVYYTLDGSAPGTDSTLYEKMFEIDKEGTVTLQAVCVDEEGNLSNILTEQYVLEFEEPDAPRVSPDGGEFNEETKVKLSAQSGTTIYYTWDGTTPDKDSKVYTEAIKIPEGNNILSVIAIDDVTDKKSDIVKTNFIYYPEVEEILPET